MIDSAGFGRFAATVALVRGSSTSGATLGSSTDAPVARIASTSFGASARGVCRLMPSVPLSCEMPLPDSNSIVLRSAVMLVTGSVFGRGAIHERAVELGLSTTPTNHSASFGGRTVTRKMRRPDASGWRVLFALT